MENDRLKKSVEILQRTVQTKNEELESKNAMLHKMMERGLFVSSEPPDPDDKPTKLACYKDIDDVDIDTLLKANIGDLDNFESILDISGSGNILPTDLPDVACDSDIEVR